jgi:hypothetical protein
VPLADLIPPAFRRADVAEKRKGGSAPVRALGANDLQSPYAMKLPERAGFVPGIPQGGIDEYQQSLGASTGTDRRSLLEELYDTYISVPWSWTCVQVIARTVTAGGLYSDWDADSGEGDQEKPQKPPEVVALDRFYAWCNPTQDIRQLLRNCIADLLVFGDAMLEVVWSGPTPVALYNLDVVTTFPVADEHGAVSKYVQLTDFGQRAEFEPREVIHISLDAARPGVFGISPTQAMLQPMMAWLWAAATGKEMLRKGLPPNLHVDLAAGLSAAETTRWDNQYRSRNLGSKNIGAPVITKGGGKVAELATGRLMDVLEAKDRARDEILAGYGVPPAEANVIESGNLGGGTGDSQHRSFMINTCDPIGAIVLEKLNFHIAVQGFGVKGWRSRFGEVDYRDSVVVEQIRDMRVRNGSWTRNRYAAEIGEPRVDGGDDPVLVERQAIIRWEDIGRYSDAEIAAMEASSQQMPGMQTPRAPKIGAESLQAQRALLRSALGAYYRAGLDESDGDQDGDEAQAAVKAQLGKDFPATAIGWVDQAEWHGPVRVPVDQIATGDREKWAASHDPGRVAKIARKLRGGGAHAAGKQLKPVILVRTPGKTQDVVADGHHHVLAYMNAGQAVWAYVGRTDHDSGPWDEMHSSQLAGNR